jgi:hypothetical protein
LGISFIKNGTAHSAHGAVVISITFIRANPGWVARIEPPSGTRYVSYRGFLSPWVEPEQPNISHADLAVFYLQILSALLYRCMKGNALNLIK